MVLGHPGTSAEARPATTRWMPKWSSEICQRTVPHRVLRTHIGQHILRGHHIEGQAERSCANICGFCGSRDECTIRLPLQTRSTRKRMVVAVSSCPSQPSAICWSRMSTATKANPCTNRPVNCPLCTTTDKKRLDALLEGGRKRARPTSDESSDDEDYFDHPLDKRH